MWGNILTHIGMHHTCMANIHQLSMLAHKINLEAHGLSKNGFLRHQMDSLLMPPIQWSVAANVKKVWFQEN